MNGRKLDLLALGLAGGEYLLNRFWLRRVTGGWLHTILVCWANDVFAGVFMLAWLNLLLGLAGLGRVCDRKWAALFLLVCALVWELAAPVFKPEAVFDLWDFVAYQVGGLLYFAGEALKTKQGKKTGKMR